MDIKKEPQHTHNSNNDYSYANKTTSSKKNVFSSIIKKLLIPLLIAIIANFCLAIINTIGLFFNGGFWFMFLTPFFGGLLLVISLPSFFIIKNKINTEKNLLAIVLFFIISIMNLYQLFAHIDMSRKLISNYRITKANQYIDNNEMDYQYCMSIDDSSYHFITCAEKLYKQGDLTGCLEIKNEAHTIYPDVYAEKTMYCGDFGTHLLDKPKLLEKALYLAENRTDIDVVNKRDRQINLKAANFDDCMEVYYSASAQTCANRILNESESLENLSKCISFSDNYQEQNKNFWGDRFNLVGSIVGGVISCTYKGVVFSGADYDGGDNFLRIYNMKNLLKEVDLFETEEDATRSALNKYKCEGFRTMESGDPELSTEIQEAIDFLNIDILYKPCASENDLAEGDIVFNLKKELLNYDLYLEENYAKNRASLLHCGAEAHLVSKEDVEFTENIKNDLANKKIYRPCADPETYLTSVEMADLDWDFKEDNFIKLVSSRQSIIFEDFNIFPSVNINQEDSSKNYYNLILPSMNHEKYDYLATLVFRDFQSMKIGKLRGRDNVSFHLNQKEIDGHKQSYICESEAYNDNFTVDVNIFEQRFGGILDIDFTAKVECRGEIFDISGKLKSRVPIQYSSFYLK